MKIYIAGKITGLDLDYAADEFERAEQHLRIVGHEPLNPMKHLFDTIERLLDPDDPMDLDRAETVGKVAQVVVNSAKVEVDFMKQTGHGGSAFMQNLPASAVERSPQLRGLELVDIEIRPDTPAEDLCQQCPLPDCDDSSPQCLIRIQRSMAA